MVEVEKAVVLSILALHSVTPSGYYKQLRGLMSGSGVDIDSVDSGGLTPLAKAVAIDSSACTAALLRANADPHIQVHTCLYTSALVTPLHY